MANAKVFFNIMMLSKYFVCYDLLVSHANTNDCRVFRFLVFLKRFTRQKVAVLFEK